MEFQKPIYFDWGMGVRSTRNNFGSTSDQLAAAFLDLRQINSQKIWIYLNRQSMHEFKRCMSVGTLFHDETLEAGSVAT